MHLALPNLLQGVATDLKAPWLRVRKASWSHATNSPMPGECKGEVACIFDEISNLVEPNERPDTDVRAGMQRGRMPERRSTNSPARRRMAKKAADQRNWLKRGDHWFHKNRLCTELSTERVRGQLQAKYLASSPTKSWATYFGASGQRPVMGPKASAPLMTLTTL
jgi:hypothetical protein